MGPLHLGEIDPDEFPGEFSLLLYAGDTPVDEVVEELGHVPNGPFWEGVAKMLVRTRAPELDGRFKYDSESGMFCAYGKDRDALEKLGWLISEVANDEAQLRRLIAEADDSRIDD